MRTRNNERDWYDIVYDEDNDDKLFVYHGFCWMGEDVDGSGRPGRFETVCGSNGFTCSLDWAFEHMGDNLEYLSDVIAGEQHYIDDMTVAEYDEMILDDDTERLQFWDLDMDAPCGRYHHVCTFLDGCDMDTVLVRKDGEPCDTALKDLLRGRSHIPETMRMLNALLEQAGYGPMTAEWAYHG